MEATEETGVPSFMGGNIPALALALAKAQGMMKAAARDGVNPHFGKTYATLAGVWDAAREPLTSNGLAVTQLPRTDGNRVSVTTVLLHAEGGWLMTEASSTARDQGPQAVGSVISYLRRYCLAAICGIAQEDDDGESAENREPANRSQQRSQPQRQQRKGPQPVANQGQKKKPEPRKAEELDTALREVPAEQATLAKLEKRLAHSQLPASAKGAALTYLDQKGVGFREDGTVMDVGGLDEYNALRIVASLEDSIRAAGATRKEG